MFVFEGNSFRLFDLCIFLIAVFFVSNLNVIVNGSTENINCDKVRYTFAEKGLSVEESKETVEELVLVCGKGPCCTEKMQRQLSEHSKRQFRTALNQTLASVSALLSNRAVKFDEFFKDMLLQSKEGFHDMFKKTYGIIYEQNSYVFTDMFEELERYYAKGRLDLLESMDSFFNTLYQKMFTVMNSQYRFSESYLVCVSDHMKELKPFGDVPNKFTAQLKRSFVATRTFAQALYMAGNVVTNMQSMVMSESCNAAVAKMTHCPACSGLNQIKPCTNYCTNVMKGCLAYHSLLDSHWNTFIDALDKIVERLLGPFNIEMVVEPIDIKISEAIMNFQENANQVSQKVFTGCGKPTLGRKKRAVVRPEELKFETLQFTPGRGKKKHQQQIEEGKLEKVVKETRARLKDTKHFWHKLPYHMCGTSASSSLDSCWNGSRQDKYTPPVVGDGMSNQQNNPEVSVDITRPSTLVNEQIFALKTVTNKLKNAYNGMDVEWIDIEETFGSGGGSGYGPVEELEEGSGMVPIIERTGDSDGRSVVEDSKNTEDNALHPIPGESPAVSYNTTNNELFPATQTSSAAIHLHRNLFYYLAPIALVWVGNTVSDWFQTPTPI